MKTLLRFFIGCCLLLIAACTSIQKSEHNIPLTPVITTQVEALTCDDYPDFLSNHARLFIHALGQEVALCSIPKNYIPSDNLLQQFPIGVLQDSIFCITGFLEVEKSFPLKQLKKLGIYFTQGDELFSTAYIPLYSLCEFLKLKGIVRFELTRRVELHLNVARPAVNAQMLLTPPDGLPEYDGSGVIIGIVDYGFDYTHPDFYDASGEVYRISRVWEQRKRGTPPAGFPYGHEMTNQEDILAAGTDTKRETHGTHVAGIACGSGKGTEYYGLAPSCEIVLVSTDRTDTGLADALRYVADYAKKVNKPCVINFSIGSSVGPHDGTSAFDRLCEQEARPGLLFTGSVGNDGNHPLFLSHKFSANDTLIKSAIVPLVQGNQIIADMWGNPGGQFSACVTLMDTLSDLEIATTPFVMTGDSTVSTFNVVADSILAVAQIATEISRYNNKPSILAQLDLIGTLPPSVVPILKIVSNSPTEVSCWLTGGIFDNLEQPSEYLSGSTSHTVNEIGGTGKAMISVGAFCTKNQWKDVTGKGYTYGPMALLHEIAYFSSKGPTADGRIKPDIICPGYGVVSSYNHFFTGIYPPHFYRVVEKEFNDNIYYWGMLQGTSEAAPIVAGTLALWLQENPQLTVDDVIKIIRETANPGGHLPLPNNSWGWGILNAGKGMSRVQGMK